MPGLKLKTVNPVVFDGKYCCCDPTDKFYDECDFFEPEKEKCWLFSKELEQNGDDIYLKCQECKDHYAKNKPVENNVSDDDEVYPCSDCGVMRSKNQGGTAFSVCDDCWDKHYEVKEHCKYCGKEITKDNLEVFKDGLGRYYCSKNCFKDHQSSKGF
jgi:hypothetical protein